MMLLRSELEELGCSTYYGPESVLQGRLAGNMTGESIAFMAHVDTADDVPGNGVKPVVHSPYNGQDIALSGITISTEENPDLIRYKDGTVVTSDGTTLLGSDDKAGIAIIMEMLSITWRMPSGYARRDGQIFIFCKAYRSRIQSVYCSRRLAVMDMFSSVCSSF